MVEIASVAIAFATGIFYHGADSAIFLFCASILLLLVNQWQLKAVFSGADICWSHVHTWVVLYSGYLIFNLFISRSVENSMQLVWVFFSFPLVLIALGGLTDSRWLSLIRLLSISGIFLAVWGIAEFITQHGRASGPGIDPNAWVSHLNLFYFLLLSVWVRQEGKASISILLLLSLVSVGIFCGYSRIGSLNFVAGLSFVGLVMCLSVQLRKKAGLIVLTALLSYALTNNIRTSEEATSHDEGYTLDVESIGWSQRIAQWQAGLDQYADYPFVGSGIASFKALYPVYRNLGDIKTAGNYVHNDYIQLLAEGGPVMLAIVLSLVIFLIYLLGRNLLHFYQYGGLKNIESIILVVAMATVLVHALMSFTLYMLTNQILLACCLARLLWLNDLLVYRSVQLKSPGLAFIGTLTVTAYIVGVKTLDFVAFDLVYKGGVVPTNADNKGQGVDLFDTLSLVSKLRPNVAATRFGLARIHSSYAEQYDNSQAEQRALLIIVAAKEYEIGIELNPYYYQVRELYADLLLQNPWLMQVEGIQQTPLKLLTEGLAFGPCYVRRYLNLAKLLKHQGQAEAAYQLLVVEALPWVGLRYDGYKEFRQELFVAILREARRQHDIETTALLLLTMEKHT
ncbi:MAG: O-antigen ligase family protein [Pseudomonadales bacterium]|nr:O-antigen ligase family protein [Pseudomonadales bacterium]